MRANERILFPEIYEKYQASLQKELEPWLREVDRALTEHDKTVIETNQEMIAVQYEPNTKELLGIGYRNISVDAASMQRRGSSR